MSSSIICNYEILHRFSVFSETQPLVTILIQKDLSSYISSMRKLRLREWSNHSFTEKRTNRNKYSRNSHSALSQNLLFRLWVYDGWMLLFPSLLKFICANLTHSDQGKTCSIHEQMNPVDSYSLNLVFWVSKTENNFVLFIFPVICHIQLNASYKLDEFPVVYNDSSY